MTQLSIPVHYDTANASVQDYHTTDVFGLQVAAQKWAAQNKLRSAVTDKKKVHMLIIDQQDDFGFPGGSLYVSGRSGTGSMDDSARQAEFIYRNLNVISEITPTMDSHLKFQVFFPSAHIYADGSSPSPFTIVSPDDYRSGKIRANPLMASFLGVDQQWLTKQFTYYTTELEKTGRLALTLWPYHCLIGSHGHKLSGVVNEAIMFHSFARGARNNPAIKGGNELTEHYSIFQPEVQTLFNGDAIPGVQKNVALLETLIRSDYVIICGEAWSHCLAWSVKDLMSYVMSLPNTSPAEKTALLSKIYILKDCTSAVVIPGLVDYTDDAQKSFDEFLNAGMHIVDSTVPIDQWPGVVL